MNQSCCTYLLKLSYNNFYRCFHNSCANKATHYETLKLQRNCTSKEVRESFLKLSKEHHPDLNKDPNAHNQFLKIQEAYNVLSKPGPKASYDLSLSNPHRHIHNVYTSKPGFRGEGPRSYWDDPYFHHQQHYERRYREEDIPFGLNHRPSKATIVFCCIILALMSFTMQMMVVRSNQMTRLSNEAEETLNEVRERANRNGNLVQLEILRKKFEEQKQRELEYLKSLERAKGRSL
ncbi:uncharacterized protein LOC115890349 isoform X2 [Sitophilus oryzae]|uniref:Uncharacterized protein LOC115890349 isoform X2 n=1 Tax=Sitophilus oryzae TaxID=7048 RepID=A0A6J2YU98_SITOR|nr:uncharacterized protein LOC115890349 isoform X2 [Sitophilus oryzae]